MKKKFTLVSTLVLVIVSLVCAFSISVSAENSEAPSVNIKKYNLVFEDNVYLKYAVKFDGVDDNEITASNIGMLYFTTPQESYIEGNEASSSAVVGYTTIDGEKYYTFEYRNLSAKQMTDYIYSIAYIDLDGERYYSASVKYSVLDYCYSKLGKTGEASTNEDFKNLLTATLEQGAMAQNYFGYNINRLANDEYYLVEVVGGILEDGFTKGLYHSGETATLTVLDKSKLICAFWQTTREKFYDIIDVLTITEFSANEIYEIVNYSNHTEIIDEAKEASCIETGLTEGKHCSVCNEVLVAQTVIDALGHAFGEWKITKYPSVDEEGQKEKTCDCGEKECEAIAKLIPSEGLAFTLNSDGTSYSLSSRGECMDANVVIPSTYDGLPVTSIGKNAFKNVALIKSVIIPDSVTSIGAHAFYYCKNLTQISIPNSGISIGNYAFYRCESLSSVSLPSDLTHISDYVFYGCKKLASVTIPDGVTKIDESAFADCINLTSIQLPKSLTIIDTRAFSGCSSLTSITIPEAVIDIGTYAFSNCSNLVSINIPKNVECIDSCAFSECTYLKNVTISESVVTIGRTAFSNCANLECISIDPNNKYYMSLNGDLYSKDGKTLIQYAIGKSNTNFIVPDGVTTIDYQAFYNCSNINSVVISNNVKFINERAFYNCTNLTNVTIGGGVTHINIYAYAYCTNLANINYNGSKEQWDAIVKYSYWDSNTGNYTVQYQYE